MPTSTVTSKGQITIPKEIRERLHLRTGHRVEFHVESSGKVTMTPRNRDLRELKGIIRTSRRKPVSIEEMNEAIAKGFSNT